MGLILLFIAINEKPNKLATLICAAATNHYFMVFKGEKSISKAWLGKNVKILCHKVV